METSLHRQLKTIYAGPDCATEVRLGRYRIDALSGERLIEIQHGSLAALRAKSAALLAQHELLIVKPLVASKLLVQRARRGGRILRRRQSPKRARLIDIFDELTYFTRVFPHPRLTLEVLLVQIEEWRFPGHGRRRWRRRGDYQIEDQKLVEIVEQRTLRTADDLLRLLPAKLPSPFHSLDLAQRMELPRWRAQRVAYCLREMGAARQVGQRGNTRLYELTARRRHRTRAA
jgi:hypothetical protein